MIAGHVRAPAGAAALPASKPSQRNPRRTGRDARYLGVPWLCLARPGGFCDHHHSMDTRIVSTGRSVPGVCVVKRKIRE